MKSSLAGSGTIPPNGYKSVSSVAVAMTYQRPTPDASSIDSCDIEANYDLSGNGGKVDDGDSSACSVNKDDVDYGYNAQPKQALSVGSVDGLSIDFDEIERQQEEEERMNTILLSKLRTVIILGIFLLILATSGAVYAFGVSRKIAAYRSRFRSQGNKMIDSMQNSLSQKMAVLESLSTTLISLAESQNQTWPFVTFANSEDLLSRYRYLLGKSVLVVCPTVHTDQQDQWELYASSEMGWVNKTQSKKSHLLRFNRRRKAKKTKGKELDDDDDDPTGSWSFPTPSMFPSPSPVASFPPSSAFFSQTRTPTFSPSEPSIVPKPIYTPAEPSTAPKEKFTSLSPAEPSISPKEIYISSSPIENSFESQEDAATTFPIKIQIENENSKARSASLFAVAWQYSPHFPGVSAWNIDRASSHDSEEILDVLSGNVAVASQIHTWTNQAEKFLFSDFLKESIRADRGSEFNSEDVLLEILYPILGGLDNEQGTVGLISSTVELSSIMGLDETSENESVGMIVKIRDNDGDMMAYEINGSARPSLTTNTKRSGGDLMVESSLSLGVSKPGGSNRRLLSTGLSVQVFPLDPGRGSWKPVVAIVIMVVFIFFSTLLLGIFHLFTFLVSSRHDRAIEKIAKTDALMASLFPAKIRKRMMLEMERSGAPQAINVRRGSLFGTEISIGSGLSRHTGVSRKSPGCASRRGSFASMASRRLSMDSIFSRRGSMGGGANRKAINDAGNGNTRRCSVGRRGSMNSSDGSVAKASLDNVIADFHPETSIIFMDIRGFTAWCSEREPGQVFTLLESIYNSFDVIASKRGVYKVETIGDCYMAVAGLPEPNPDHAVVICEFARECLKKMKGLCKDLEIFLGPGTAALDLRIGIHSGPAVAGVLRTGNARFQLFGDSVNIASRMESTGRAGQVQMSTQTAEELGKHGYEDWCWPRKDVVYAKGKGELQTYWLDLFDKFDPLPTNALNDSSNIIREKTETEEDTSEAVALSDENERLINWVVERLSQLLKKIETWHTMQVFELASTDLVLDVDEDDPVVDEVQEVIKFMGVDGAEYKDVEEIVAVDPRVIAQLKELVTEIAKNYKNNAFHNLAHASHVTMSVVKLLSRISILKKDPSLGPAHAIASDPLVQFALVFAALIHDVGHPGVSNAQLVKENDRLAVAYRGRSVAESHSIQIAWRILMKGKYKDLRRAIFCNEVEMQRFRHLIVNLVIATDLFDPRLQKTREALWSEAFEDNSEELSIAGVDDDHHDVERQATMIIGFLIQASDLSHMMQHFQTYMKWNERLFEESVDAYQSGRLQKDPSLTWYAGELAFFDNYVIPLAKKLKDCAVFGVSSDEYLQFAEANRKEWEVCGRDIVDEMQLKYML